MRLQDLVFPVGIVASVLVILVPLPAALMDLLLSANVAIAVIMLLTTIYVRTPLEFSIFPSLLLATTLFRLVLNVATTRLILTRAAADGLFAAGGVVKTFGEFVTGGSTGTDKIVVGLIIFAIIVIIQFVVITKGATRISEVAARFALDGMPGRQMAIDADLNAGIIDEREAQRRRKEIGQQADFFGAMDGASKFVRGDAIAGIIITLINIVGGLFIGMIESGMSLGQAASLFTTLTIGDGLVSQVPAFLISLAAGLLVTRSSSDSDLPQGIRAATVFASAGPGRGGRFPLDPDLHQPAADSAPGDWRHVHRAGRVDDPPRHGGQGGHRGEEAGRSRQAGRDPRGRLLERRSDGGRDRRGADPPGRSPPRRRPAGTHPARPPERGRRDRHHPAQGPHPRQHAAGPEPVSHQDRRHAGRRGHWSMRPSSSPWTPARGNRPGRGRVQGMATREPAFGTPAVWIEPALRDQAEMHGYTVVEPGSVIATHLTETIRRHADEILTRDSTKHLIDELKRTSPVVVDELVPGVMKLSEVQQILQMLLREGVPIRQLGPILETLGDYAPRTKEPILLTEYVRHRLARSICTRYRNAENRLFVVTLDPALEDRIRAGFEHNEHGLFVRMSPQAVEATCRQIAAGIERLTLANHPPVVLVSPQIRAALRQMTVSHLPNLVVLSYNEITRDTKIEAMAMVADAR